MKIVAQPASADASAMQRIASALQTASARTGTGFDYLLKTAQRESNFNPAAKAPTSSATGLFQFIDSTWLGVMRENGARFGLEREAAAIEPAGAGRYTVRDPAMRNHIMALRTDPSVAALMAGAFTEDNAAYLQEKIGRAPNDGELYIAHFLGAGGAAEMINLASNRPNDRAADHFPAAARANKSIFYAGGKPRSIAQVYANLVAKHEGTAAPAIPAAGAYSPRLFSPVTGEAPPVVASSRPGGMFQTLFRPASATGLGPSAQGSMSVLNLFASPQPSVAASDEVAAIVDAAPVARTQRVTPAFDPLSRGSADAASVTNSRTEGPVRSAGPTEERAVSTMPQPTGFQRILSGLASIFGFGGNRG